MALIKLVGGLLLRELSYNFPVVPGILPVKTSIIILDKKQQKQQQINNNKTTPQQVVRCTACYFV